MVNEELDGQLYCWSGILGTYDYSIIYHLCGNCHYCEQVEVKNQKKLTNDIPCQLNTMQSSNWFLDRTAGESRDLQLNNNNLAMMIDWKEKNIQPIWAKYPSFIMS